MYIKRRLFITFLLLNFASLLHGQAWSGILDPSRAIDWSIAGVTGGIPNRTTNCATLNPGATASQINSAINSCPSGQVVFLNAGTYNLNATIRMKSNVTLRGGGASSTHLIFSAENTCYYGAGGCAIAFEGYYDPTFWGSAPGPFGADPNKTRAWTGTNGRSGAYTKGSTILNLASAPSGLSVGDMLFLYQNDDSGPNGTFFVCGSCAVSLDGSGSSFGTGEQQAVKVTAISGSQVTITPGVYTDNYSTPKSPRVYWWTGDVRNAGIEDFSIDTGSVSGYSNVEFFQATDSWMKGIASSETGSRNHADVFLSRNITIQSSYFYNSCVGGCGGGATGYGIEFEASSASAAINNILNNIQAPWVWSVGAAGNVLAYNFENSTGGATATDFHEEGNMMHLLEGNYTNAIIADAFHGTNMFITSFRNQIAGNGRQPNDIWTYNRYHNSIGNVIGTSGITLTYECNNGDTSANCDIYSSHNAAFRLGYGYQNSSGGPCGYARCGSVVPCEGIVKATLMRWGNYDTATATVRFVAAEVPSGLNQYANPVPTSQNLPASFYFSGQPSSWWTTPWGTPPWPAIGPDVSGGNVAGVGGHANKIPAQLCYENTSSVSNFDETRCYQANQQQLDPPSNLVALPQ